MNTNGIIGYFSVFVLTSIYPEESGESCYCSPVCQPLRSTERGRDGADTGSGFAPIAARACSSGSTLSCDYDELSINIILSIRGGLDYWYLYTKNCMYFK